MIHDFAIVGGGIAGAGLAAELAPHGSMLLLEMEAQPGYHTTGRSNALWHITYGGPQIEPLTAASKAYFDTPPGAARDAPLLTFRGGVQLAERGREAGLDRFEDAFRDSGVNLERVQIERLRSLIPGLRTGWDEGVFEPEIFDIDVAGLHEVFLSQARQAGTVLQCSARLLAVHATNGHWRLETSKGSFEARLLVNAAGAWADEVAELAGCRPMSVQPLRRTIAQVELASPVAANTPFVADVDSRFYFKPEGEWRAWISPADETPSVACDAAPEELDIAIGIDWFQKVVDWPVKRVEHKWAGLRSFAPDRLPLFGFDPEVANFFWCAGQGGFGIQTAPAASQLCADLIIGSGTRESLAGVNPAIYVPSRFRN